MQLFVRILAGAVSAYMLLLILRIFLTWFSSFRGERAYLLLEKVTDPYLSLFQRISFLKTKRIDFTPIAAFLVLGVVVNILNTLAAYGRISLGIILAIIVSSLWSSFSWILSFFIILLGIRLVTLLLRVNSVSPLIQTVDIITQPILNWFTRLIFRGRIPFYRTILIYSLISLLLIRFLGSFLIQLILRLLFSLPF